MAYQRTSLSQLKARLLERLGGQGRFWSEAEQELAINEALAVWQLMTGDFVLSRRVDYAAPTSNLIVQTTEDIPFAATLRVNCIGGTLLRVFYTYNENPMPGEPITAFRNDSLVTPIGTVVTDVNGIADFGALPAGTLTVYARTSDGQNSGWETLPVPAEPIYTYTIYGNPV